MKVSTLLHVFVGLPQALCLNILAHQAALHRTLQTFFPTRTGPFTSSPLDDLHSFLSDHLPLSALQLGAFFPDWDLVVPFPARSNSEEWRFGDEEKGKRNHGVEFLWAGLHVFRRKYGLEKEGWGEEGLALLGFLMGFASHLSSEVVWEGLDAGLLMTTVKGDRRALERVEVLAAEGVILAADWVQVEEGTKVFEQPWFLPEKDVKEIYAKLARTGFTPEDPVPSLGTAMALLRAELVAGYQDLNLAGKHAPVFFENLNYETFPLGGIRQLARSTMDCWNGILRFLTSSPNNSTSRPYLCPTLRKLPNSQGICTKPTFFPRITALASTFYSSGKVLTDPSSSSTTISILLDETTTPPFLPPPKVLPEPVGYQKPTYLSTYVANSHFGYSLQLVEVSGTRYLAVGAPWETVVRMVPQEGSVFYLPLESIAALQGERKAPGAEMLRLEKSRPLSKYASAAENAIPQIPNFGFAQAVWNAHPSLPNLHAVSSTGFSSSFSEGKQEVRFGEVSIFQDTSLLFKINSKACGELEEKDCGQTFAEVLEAGKVSNLSVLAIGSPRGRDDRGNANGGAVNLVYAQEAASDVLKRVEHNNGALMITRSKATAFAPKLQILQLSINNPNPAPYAHFGSSNAFSNDHLLVSAPPLIHVYTLSSGTTPRPSLLYTFTAPSSSNTTNSSDFGSKIHTLPASDGYVLISLPSWKEHRGALALYRVSAKEAKFLTWISDPNASEGERFGGAVCIRADGVVMVGSGQAEGVRGAVWEVVIGGLEGLGDGQKEKVLRSQRAEPSQLTVQPDSEAGVEAEIKVLVRRVISGDTIGGMTGSALVCPGDLDGDGKEDLLVGMPGRGVGWSSGAVQVYLGK